MPFAVNYSGKMQMNKYPKLVPFLPLKYSDMLFSILTTFRVIEIYVLDQTAGLSFFNCSCAGSQRITILFPCILMCYKVCATSSCPKVSFQQR